MVLYFNNQLKLVVPISKKTSPTRVLETSIKEHEIRNRIKYWFPMFDRMILNARQGKLRAYKSLPDHFLLFYEVSKMENGKQKWDKVYKIQVFRDLSMRLYDYRTDETFN